MDSGHFEVFRSNYVSQGSIFGFDASSQGTYRQTDHERGKKKWNYPADPSIVRDDSFVELINRSAQNGKDALTHAWNYLENKMSRSAFLKEYQGYNLDTGLRFQGVDSMKEFSPLEEV